MLQTGIILSFIFIVLVVAFAYLYSDKSSRNRDPNAVWEDMARKQIAHQYVGVHATPEVLNTAKEEVKKEEIKEEKKKSIVGTGNLLDMINGFDRVKGKREARKNIKEPPRHDPKDSFRGDITRIIREVEQEKQKAVAESYHKNMNNVLNHFKKQNA